MNKIRRIESITKSKLIDLKKEKNENSNKQDSKEFEKILKKELDRRRKK